MFKFMYVQSNMVIRKKQKISLMPNVPKGFHDIVDHEYRGLFLVKSANFHETAPYPWRSL